MMWSQERIHYIYPSCLLKPFAMPDSKSWSRRAGGIQGKMGSGGVSLVQKERIRELSHTLCQGDEAASVRVFDAFYVDFHMTVHCMPPIGMLVIEGRGLVLKLRIVVLCLAILVGRADASSVLRGEILVSSEWSVSLRVAPRKALTFVARCMSQSWVVGTEIGRAATDT
jgi:hypothetical protein